MTMIYGHMRVAVAHLAMLLILFSPLFPTSTTTFVASGEEEPPSLMTVPLYLAQSGSISLLLTPILQNGTGTTVVGIDSNPIPGSLGYMPLGSWSTNELNAPILINGDFTCDLWVSSDNDARNVKIMVTALRDDEDVTTLNTTIDTLSDNPVKLRMTGNLSTDLQAGQVFVIRVLFDAPKLGGLFSEFAHVTLHYGGKEYPSGVIMQTDPFSVEIPEPDVTPDDATFRARVIEAFDISNPADLNFSISLSGPTKPSSIMKAEAKKYDNEAGHPIVISVGWDYTKDEAKDGLYSMEIKVSYDGKTYFTASNSSELKFPTPPPEDITKMKISKNTLMYGAIAGILIFAVVAYFLVVRPRYRTKKGLLARSAKALGKGKARSQRKGAMEEVGGDEEVTENGEEKEAEDERPEPEEGIEDVEDDEVDGDEVLGRPQQRKKGRGR